MENENRRNMRNWNTIDIPKNILDCNVLFQVEKDEGKHLLMFMFSNTIYPLNYRQTKEDIKYKKFLIEKFNPSNTIQIRFSHTKKYNPDKNYPTP